MPQASVARIERRFAGVGLLAPAGTPRPIVDKVAAAAHQAMHAPDAIATLRKQPA